jgi:hypothetical protein
MTDRTHASATSDAADTTHGSPAPAPGARAAGVVQLSMVHPLPRCVTLQNAAVNLAMYAAIVGKVPQIDPEAPDVLSPAGPAPRLQRPWSPVVLSIYLRDAYRQSALKLTKPEIAAWIRRQSVSARKRIHETQHRLATARGGRAA